MKALARLSVRLAGLGLLALRSLPLVALAITAGRSGRWEGLTHPLVLPALAVSLRTTAISLAIVVLLGTPLAWRVARGPSARGIRWIETLVQLPVVTPPAVAGVALLLLWGRRGLVGRWLDPLGIHVAFTQPAVVLAEIFVSAPFFVQAAIVAFRQLDEGLLVVARSLGASPARAFFRVALPLSAPGLLAGAAMSWARSLGEFGATLMFAGNLTGRTQTLPLAIYAALESDLRAAQSLSLVLVGIAFALLLAVRAKARGILDPALAGRMGGRARAAP
jgi:molybdate transport system permease protein